MCPIRSTERRAHGAGPGYGRGDWIRTSDFLLPKQALYQAELRPETDYVAAGNVAADNVAENLGLAALRDKPKRTGGATAA